MIVSIIDLKINLAILEIISILPIMKNLAFFMIQVPHDRSYDYYHLSIHIIPIILIILTILTIYLILLSSILSKMPATYVILRPFASRLHLVSLLIFVLIPGYSSKAFCWESYLRMQWSRSHILPYTSLLIYRCHIC